MKEYLYTAKKIKDVSQEIANKHSVSKKDVENIFEYFYQTVLKDELTNFRNDEIGIKHLGVFRVNIYRFPSLKEKCETRLKEYALEYEKLKESLSEEEVSSHWKTKSFFYYQRVIENLKKIEETKDEKDSIKLEKRKLRQYELDRETEKD